MLYLPPDGSPYGRDSSSFFSHLLAQMYMLCEADMTLICGDLNSKTGGLNDFVPGIDNVDVRTPIDLSTNQHGKSLIEFLLESKMAVRMITSRLCQIEGDLWSITLLLHTTTLITVCISRLH